MSRSFYSGYVQHCMRFYVRCPKPVFYNDVGQQNWKACERALKGFSEWAKDVLTAVYSNGDTLADSVYQVSKNRGVEQDKVWKLIRKLERKVAKERGLI